MKLKKKYKNWVVLSLFIALTFVAVLGIRSLLDTDESTINKRYHSVSIGSGDGYESWASGEWSVSTHFSAVGSNVSVPDDGLSATVGGAGSSVDANAVELKYSISYLGGTYSSSFYPSQMAIALPLYVYEVASEYTYEYDADSNSLKFSNSNGNYVGYLGFGNMTYCPSDDDGTCMSTATSLVAQVFDGTLMVFNATEINGNSDYNISFSLEYSFINSELVADTVHSVESYIYIAAESPVTLDTLTTNYTQVGSESDIDLSTIEAFEEGVYTSWDTEYWGEAQHTESYDYYVEYYIDGALNFESEYSYKYSISEINGDLLAHSADWYEYEYVGVDDFNSSNLCSNTVTGESYPSCVIVVGYKLDGASSLNAVFKVDLEVAVGGVSKSSSFEWNTLLEQLEAAEYPTGYNKAFTQTLLSDDAGVGAVDALRNGTDVSFEWKIEPTASSMNTTGSSAVKAFNLWNLTSEGTTPYTFDIETNGGYVDSSYNTVVNPLTLTNNEYTYDSFYLLDDIEYDYVLNTNGTEYYLTESDITTYTGKFVYVKINDGEYELIGSISKNANGTIDYVASGDKTVNTINVSATNPVVLPDNVTDIKITYVGTKAAVYIGLGYTSVLTSSDDLIAKINELELAGSDIVLKNHAQLSVASTLESEKLTGTYLTSAYESSTSYGTDSVVNDVYTDSNGVKYDSITYTDYVFEQLNYSTDSASAKEFITEQNNVTVYQLLPTGAVLNGNVNAYTYGNEVAVTTNVTTTDNYNGSGRTLLKIDITLPSGVTNIYEGSGYLQTGFKLVYDVLYSYSANQNYGTTLYKEMAYYSNDVLTDGVSNASLANSSSFSSSSAQNTMATLNTSNALDNAVFTTETVTIDKVTITEGDYLKQTKNDSETSYVDNTNVVESKKYSYRLQYVFASDYEEIENLVFVDKLESSYTNNQYFKGYLDSIDTSYLNGLGVTTKIYYSTDTEVDLENLDLTDTGSWSTTKPSSGIVAIAISCGDYLFKGSDNVSPMVDITMIAPNEYEEDIMAYNESFINYNYLGESNVRTMSSDVTTVELLEAPIIISASTSVGESTESNPGIVEDSFEYIVELGNNGNDVLENITYEVILPVGISVDTTLISEVSNDNNGVFGTYSYDSTNRVLTYSVTKLLGMEEKIITIPVSISYNDLSSVTSFETSVQLVELGDLEYDGEVLTLYNKLAVPELVYQKYVDTLDTDGFTDEATVIIEKGETYSYRVFVDNISTVDAKDVEIVDIVAAGLTVDETTITNNGVYDSSSNTITWSLETLKADDSINLEYSVKVADDITLGTVYRSSAHISVVNPIDNSLMLYDDDTNVVSTLYQIVSNLKVTNELVGALADTEKEFSYTFEFSGDASFAGDYNVVDSIGNTVGTLTLDSAGKGTYITTLEGNEFIEFKLLPNGITYTIKQEIEKGYEVVASGSTIDGNSVVITGVTAEEKQISYIYTNSYSVSTSVDVSAEVTYDKEMTADMFALTITDDNGYTDTKYTDEFGIINFDTLNYNDVEGTYTYTINQVNTGINKIAYDVSTYTVVVKLTNDGEGNLNSDVKYYNKLNEEVTDIVFVNEYVPNGLIIQNVNTSDYVDTTKEFKYTLEITDSIDNAGTYIINDKDGNKLTDLVIDDTGYAKYEFTLLSDEKITVLDLPANTNYTVTQEMVDYYTSNVSDLSYTVDTENKLIVHNGTTEDASIQILFNNNYVTSGEFTPSSAVVLLEKELELEEFSFMIKDVSDGITNGYVEVVSNTIEGNLEFTTIEYTRPGTYVYEITQVKGDSNHIYYDLSKCILTVTLVDNGDSTMTVESSLYEYESGKEYFENTYSVEPIVPEYVDTDKNPNTEEGISKFGIVIMMIIMVIGLFLVEKNLRRKRLSV